MDKRHWITIDIPAPLTLEELRELITQSHRIVTAALTCAVRTQLGLT
jgi:predicted DNA-binding protein (MmcQ/YjbR family)